jgi:TPR repeat protein
MKMGGTCPFCRAKTPSCAEDHIKYLRPWVKKKKAWAQNMMGQMYYNGVGVKQSYKMAKMLLEQAAQQGDVGAMKSLGFMYEHGQGVQRDLKKAREWWTKAAAQGDEQAIKNLKILDKKEGQTSTA